jgi:hypothetical protein
MTTAGLAASASVAATDNDGMSDEKPKTLSASNLGMLPPKVVRASSKDCISFPWYAVRN